MHRPTFIGDRVAVILQFNSTGRKFLKDFERSDLPNSLTP